MILSFIVKFYWGHKFGFVISQLWEKLLTNCFFENEWQFIWCYNVRIFFWNHRFKVQKLGWTQIGAENCPNPPSKSYLTIRSRKCVKCDIICIVWTRKSYGIILIRKSLLVWPKTLKIPRFWAQNWPKTVFFRYTDPETSPKLMYH